MEEHEIPDSMSRSTARFDAASPSYGHFGRPNKQEPLVFQTKLGQPETMGAGAAVTDRHPAWQLPSTWGQGQGLPLGLLLQVKRSPCSPNLIPLTRGAGLTRCMRRVRHAGAGPGSHPFTRRMAVGQSLLHNSAPSPQPHASPPCAPLLDPHPQPHPVSAPSTSSARPAAPSRTQLPAALPAGDQCEPRSRWVP